MERTTITPIIRLLRVSEVAEMLAVSSAYVYLLIQRHKLPAVLMGRSKRVKQEDVNAYIDANTTSRLSGQIDYNER